MASSGAMKMPQLSARVHARLRHLRGGAVAQTRVLTTNSTRTEEQVGRMKPFSKPFKNLHGS